jgi:cell division protein FtsZ
MSIKDNNIVVKPVITVIGVGGAGNNVINNMIEGNLQGVDFIVANTDAQALEHSKAEKKIQLGANITRGLGAGATPQVGAAAAEESIEEIRSHLENSHLVFITAGMGGGTGSGAAPVVAKLAKEMGILTVGVVTKPFDFEGGFRMRTALAGLVELQKYVDTMIIIPNQNLFRVTNERTPLKQAFEMADKVLFEGVRSVTDLIIMPGLINLDFADIKTIMADMGKAMMGTGEASGEDRAIKAAEAAISNPLIDHNSIRGAKGVLINISSDHSMTLAEVDMAANFIRDAVKNHDANIIFGSAFNPALEGIIRVSVVATGIDEDHPVDHSPKAVHSKEQLERPRLESFISEDPALMPAAILPDDAYNEQLSFSAVDVTRSTPTLSGVKEKSSDTTTEVSHNKVENKTGIEIYDVPAFLRQKK